MRLRPVTLSRRVIGVRRGEVASTLALSSRATSALRAASAGNGARKMAAGAAGAGVPAAAGGGGSGNSRVTSVRAARSDRSRLGAGWNRHAHPLERDPPGVEALLAADACPHEEHQGGRGGFHPGAGLGHTLSQIGVQRSHVGG